jgi:hypothetical protein
MGHPHGKPMGTGRSERTTGNKGRVANKTDMASGMPCHKVKSNPDGRRTPANQTAKDGPLRKARS